MHPLMKCPADTLGNQAGVPHTAGPLGLGLPIPLPIALLATGQFTTFLEKEPVPLCEITASLRPLCDLGLEGVLQGSDL